MCITGVRRAVHTRVASTASRSGTDPSCPWPSFPPSSGAFGSSSSRSSPSCTARVLVGRRGVKGEGWKRVEWGQGEEGRACGYVGVRGGRQDSVSGGEGQPLERAWLIMGAARLAGDTPTRRTSHPGGDLIGWVRSGASERPCPVAMMPRQPPPSFSPNVSRLTWHCARMPHTIPTPKPTGRECTFGTRGTVPGTAHIVPHLPH